MPDMPPASLPPDLPVPLDDGACDHLAGARLPNVALRSTAGGSVNLADARGTLVVFVYPHTGRPDTPTPKEWDLIPGARGCTPEACAYRDLHADLRGLGAKVYGVSIDPPEWQREAVERLHLPFELLSDQNRSWSRPLRLPTFAFQNQIFLKRLTLVLEGNRVRKVFYPVFPPDRNPADVIKFLGSDLRTIR
ncbi:MAG: peroxiredoxin [Methanobacteriota archaeon]|nr:MAG: peroxiredoxin [Euryarchaeota archaeon]